MPHVVFEGRVDVAAFARAFEPVLIRRNGDVLRADSVYLEGSGRTALVECLAVEARRKQSFYAKLSTHDRGAATLRVDPMTHPDRSPGVRDLVAALAAQVLQRNPGVSVGAANVVVPSPGAGTGHPSEGSNA